MIYGLYYDILLESSNLKTVRNAIQLYEESGNNIFSRETLLPDYGEWGLAALC